MPGAAKYVFLTTWVYQALYDGYWAHLVKQLGTNPLTWNGAEPNPQSTLPQCLLQRTAAPSTPTRRQAPPNSPPPFRARDTHFTPTLPRRNAPQHLQESKRHQDAKSHPDRIRAITIITIRKR